MARTMLEMLQSYEGLVTQVRHDHKKKNALWGSGHGFDHAYAVAGNCLKIADGEMATLAWIAAMCHNTDRHYGEDAAEEMVRQYLSLTDFTDSKKALITEAVLNHSHRPSDQDSQVTVILMDADKLANINLTVIIRASQFRPNDPIMDLRYPDLNERPPGITYKKPGSIMRDMMGCLEWEEEGWFRIPKAKELAKPLFQKLRQLKDDIVLQIKEAGLLDYPFKEDFAK